MPSTVESSQRASRLALERACEHLLALQDPAGWWRGELQTNVTMDAEDMLLREFLGVRTAAETERSAAWIRSQQRADGTWANFHGGPGDLSTHGRGLLGAAPGRRGARGGAHARGGGVRARVRRRVEGARVFTHVWLALFGLWPWERVPALPPEIVLLPRVGAAEHLQLRVLGAADDRGALAGERAPPAPAAGLDLRELHGPRASARGPVAAGPSARAPRA